MKNFRLHEGRGVAFFCKQMGKGCVSTQSTTCLVKGAASLVKPNFTTPTFHWDRTLTPGKWIFRVTERKFSEANILNNSKIKLSDAIFLELFFS